MKITHHSKLGKLVHRLMGIFLQIDTPISLSSDLRERSMHYAQEAIFDWDAVYIMTRYEGDMARSIREMKYYGAQEHISLYREIVCDGMNNILSSLPISYKSGDPVWIVYPPFHPLHVVTRPYNHARVLAHIVEKSAHQMGCSSWKVANMFLKKRYLSHQSHLSREERISHLDGAFRLAPWLNLDTIKNQNYILVDDVISSGATLASMSRLLRENGAASITVIALSSTVC